MLTWWSWSMEWTVIVVPSLREAVGTTLRYAYTHACTFAQVDATHTDTHTHTHTYVYAPTH